MKTIKGKTALLTGASGGIGKYIARALAREGATVVGISRSPEELAKICAEVESLGSKAIAIPFDLAQLAELPILIEKIQQQAGTVDILINNAAIEKFLPFQEYALEDIQETLKINLQAPMELTRLLLPGMLKRDRGHLVNIASGSGKKGAPYNSIYSASKAGLIMWADSLGQELAATNVGVSVICPGYTNAGMYHALNITAPKAADVAEPTVVADAVIQAIAENRKEIVIDGINARVFQALIQIFPQWGDKILRQVGALELNHRCAQKQLTAKNLQQFLEKKAPYSN
ncbi:MAG: SDR family oxidoreductase [Cyanobacteria bacterium P01_A01_bin.83]